MLNNIETSLGESELPLANLSHDSNYDLRWRGFSNQSENESDCRSKIRKLLHFQQHSASAQLQ